MQLYGRIGVALTVVAAFLQFIALVSRGLAADPVRVPWGNMYEFTLMGTWVVVVGYLLLYKRFGLSWLSPVVTSFVLVTLMVDVLLLYTPVTPLRDALNSPWLVIHVVAAIIATGAFTLGGMCSALFLIKQRWEEKQATGGRTGGYLARLPTLDVLDRIAYRTHRLRASRSGPSRRSSPGRSGPTTRGAATGAGTPRRCGRSSPGWCTRRTCTPAPPRAGRAARPRSSR